jgi:UDP-glucose 4-epimerase
MHVVITGAAGRIGREMVEELSSAHELCLIDKRAAAGIASITADLSKTRRPFYKRWRSDPGVSWIECMKGADAVVHLAAEASPEASWQRVVRNNIEATWNVCEAAARHHVPRVVFASSNYAVKALEKELAPACYAVGGPKIGSHAAPRPLTPYGISKAAGEFVGQTFVAQKKLLSFVAVRIGAFGALPPKGPPWRNLWIGVRDIRNLLHRCVEADFSGFEVVYGVSAQPTAPYDLSRTRHLLCWEPQETLMNFQAGDDSPCLSLSSLSS